VISYEISPDGTYVLPRGIATALMWVRVEDHRGPREVALGAAPRSAGAAHARASDLHARWSRAGIVLERLLLWAVRAVAAGSSPMQIKGAVARVEPAPGILVVPLRTPTLPPATHTNCILVGGAELVLVEPATPYPEELVRLEQILVELGRVGRRVV